MEPVGLAVGVIGLAGLFNTCIDAAARIDTYKEFKSESRSLTAQFQASKLRFEQWGKAIGFGTNHHHAALNDPQTLSAVQELLEIIREICRDEGSSQFSHPSHLQQPPQSTKPLTRLGPLTGSLTRSQTLPARSGLVDSKRNKLVWALKGKVKRAAQVEQFGVLVQHLHNLVPLDVAVPRDNGPQKALDSAFFGLADTSTWAADVQKVLAQIEEQIEAEIRREVHVWLDESSPSELYEESLQKRLDDTCGWILNQPEFAEWLSPTFSSQAAKLLWINGPAGFGKTILCARVVEHLSSSLGSPVAHFFFSSDFESRADPFQALRSWISQVISSNQDAFELVRTKREARREQTATKTTILQILQEIVQTIPGCSFVIDGLDECTSLRDAGAGSIVAFLGKMGRAIANTSTRVLIVSRPETEIRRGIEDIDCNFTEYTITPLNVESDANLYSKSIVEKKLPKKSITLKDSISQKMAERCGGQFLWLKMQEDSLRSWKNQRQLEDAIEKTPSGLDQLYHKNWMRLSQLPEDERVRAFSLLRWVAFAVRPLTVAEVSEAVLIDLDTDELAVDELPDFVDEDYIESEILGPCGSLLEIRSNSSDPPGLQVVRLAHFSVKQYFLAHSPTLGSHQDLKLSSEVSENTHLAQACLIYLNYSQIWQDVTEEDASQVAKSFRSYAAGSWHRHVRMGEAGCPDLAALIEALFDLANENWEPWRHWFIKNVDVDGDTDSEAAEDETGTDHPLFYASKLDLTQTAICLIPDNAQSVNMKGLLGQTALAAACENGNETLVKALLDSGADGNIPDKNGKTPLHVVALKGYEKIACMLLDEGFDVNTVNDGGNTPLFIASVYGHVEVARLFVQHGVNIAQRNSRGASAIHGAAGEGFAEMVDFFLAEGADVSARDNREWTPLHNASAAGSVEVAKLLLRNGADISAVIDDGAGPLFIAAHKGHTGVARLLISHGADVQAVDEDGWSALSMAACSNHTDMVQLLVECGHKDLAVNHAGNPLIFAAINGNLEAVKILVQHGADVKAKRDNGLTALDEAITYGHIDIFSYLLKNGAEISGVDEWGGTALISSVSSGNLEIFRLLLEAGSDVTIADNYGTTPLIMAAIYGRTEMARVLIQQGADVSSRNCEGTTPLAFAAQGGHVELSELLIDEGADILAKTLKEMSPLNLACLNDHTQMVRLLLDRGADIATADDKGWTPLHFAALFGRSDIVKLLLDRGADMTAINNYGDTPFQTSLLGRYHEVVSLFMERNEIDNTQGEDVQVASLSWAASIENMEMIKSFLEQGVDVSNVGVDGSTALHHAAYFGRVEAARLLLERGANCTATDAYRMTPLHAAARDGELEFVEQLFEISDPGLDLQDSIGRTALHLASMRGHHDVVQLLLTKNAQVDIEDCYNSTALFLAIRNGHDGVVERLLAVGNIAFDALDAFGRTLFWWAQRSKSARVVELLTNLSDEVGIQLLEESLPEHEGESGEDGDVAEWQTWWCDICTRSISGSKLYECSKCNGGDFIVCLECFASGVKCGQSSHEWRLIEREKETEE